MSVSAPHKVLSLTVIGAIAATLVTGCSPTPQPQSQPPVQSAPAGDDYIQVCQDKDTEQRVEDEKCEGEQRPANYVPTYYHYDSLIPSIGAAMLVGYLMSPPRSSTVYRGAVPRTGGYAPATRPNSGFLKVPADFVGGVPPIPPAPTSVPSQAAATAPPRATTPAAAQTSAPRATAPAPATTQQPAPAATRGSTGTTATKAPGSTKKEAADKEAETKRTSPKRAKTRRR